jgi:glucokinase
MARRVGVDIGGSGVRAAAVHEASIGPVVRMDLAERTPAAVVAAVVEAVERLGGADRLGVGVPGFVREGVILGSPNLPDLAGFDLRSALSARTGAAVAVENDANAAALGAWREGDGGDLVVLTLGTGVGGGVITDGRLLRGAAGTGAEVGHIFAGGDRACACGGVGCLETWCGTVGLTGRAAAAGHPVPDGRAILSAARRGEPWALALLRDSGEALGRGLVTLVNLFAPDRVLITGGLVAAREFMAGPAAAWLTAHGVGPSVAHVRVEWMEGAPRWAILGAASALEA